MATTPETAQPETAQPEAVQPDAAQQPHRARAGTMPRRSGAPGSPKPPKPSKPLAARRMIATPEGIEITLTLASRGARLMALILDLTIIIALLIALLIFVAWLGFETRGGDTLLFIVTVLVATFMRLVYFILLEARPRGQTLGKRAMGIRVADRRGGALTVNAVIGRNLMREAELFAPLFVMLSASVGGGNGLSDTGWWSTVVWMLVMPALPLFLRDRQRPGDLVAGTWVIETVKPVLLPDLAQAAPSVGEAPTFTDDQLAIYGLHELQTLERVLQAPGQQSLQIQVDVAKRIKRKIGHDAEVETYTAARAFLDAFYRAQRGRLEAGLMMGKRRESKWG